ncbi:Rrm1 protein [Trametes cingulata]|nr:Rrm1 protein [Trametes cingulata]
MKLTPELDGLPGRRMDRNSTVCTVRKRGARTEPFLPDKLLSTLRKLSFDLHVEHMDLGRIMWDVERGKVPNMSSDEIQMQAALAASNLTGIHPDHARLAGRLEIAALHRRTQKSFSRFVIGLDKDCPGLLAKEFVNVVQQHSDALDSAIRHSRDYDLDYSSIKTLEHSYLFSINGRVVERPQCLFMRVAVSIHLDDIQSALETYDLLSRSLYIHATPTLLNAGKASAQLSSCFLARADTSTISATYEGLKDVAGIFMQDGGVGLDLHTVPARRSDRIHPQPGVVPYLRLVDDTVKLTTHGRRSRPSAATAYLPIWHADVLEFIDLRSNRGQEELRTRNIFTALMIPDIFMRRVEDGGDWSLFDPVDVPELLGLWGDDFAAVYIALEATDKRHTSIPARDLWSHVMYAQMETGTPFILYQDVINAKSNQQNVGMITSSNLCTEIVQYVSDEETAVCTLASVVLPSFVNEDGEFDLAELHRVTKIVTRNVDRLIDRIAYPTPEARLSATRHRAIGVGVQGLADVFMILGMPYDSPEARFLNRTIFETIYHAALDASCDLARTYGPYETWQGSPASRMCLQYDLWGVQTLGVNDFESLKMRIKKFGLRNSLLVAQMPTTSTSQIVGVNDGTDPYISNVYVRRSLSGEFQIVCKWLVRDLIAEGLWTERVRRAIAEAHGSIQSIPAIPQSIKDLYKTAWEIPQQCVVDMAADRGPYICQSQSLTIHMAAPTVNKLTSMHFHGWRRGLKTGMYYLRTQPAVYPIHFGLEPATPCAEDFNDDPRVSTPASTDSSDDESDTSSEGTNNLSGSSSYASSPLTCNHTLPGNGHPFQKECGHITQIQVQQPACFMCSA